MKKLSSYQRGIVFRFVILIVLMLILTEFVDSKILHELGLRYGGFEIHFVKVLVTAFFSIPITSFWLKDYLKFREAEGRRHEEQKDFRSLFDYNPSMIILYSMEGKYLDANPAYLRYTGFTMEELRSAPPFISVDEAFRLQIKNHFQKAALGNIEHVVEKLKLYSGQEVILDVLYFPVYRNGVASGVYAITRDVTKEKAMEQELVQYQAFMNAFIYHATDAIGIVDPEGIAILVNPAWEALYGWKLSEISGKRAPFIDMDFFQSVLESREAISKERKIMTKSGRVVPVAVSAAPVLSTNDTLLGVSFISTDITERLETEEWMRRSEKLAVSGELAAGLAHEIRNPLTAIRGFLQLMKERPNDRYLDVLMEEVDRINQLTNELLMLAKPQENVFEEVNIVTILRELLPLMRSQANLQAIVIHEDIPSTLPPVHGVKDQLKQVFINIIKNAMEAQPSGGYVDIVANLDDAHIVISIEDGGTGMSQETMGKLGEPFYTTKERGSGLGMMVTYLIIQNHQGDIHVDSEIGRGTRFVVILPY